MARPSPRTRARVIERYASRCVYCGGIFPAQELTIDHVEPRRIGGDQSEGNLVTCCPGCNREKGGVAAWKYLTCHPEKRAMFLTLATGVWPRLRRAIEEAAEKSDTGT